MSDNIIGPPNIEVPHTGNKAVDWAVHSVAINLVTKGLIGFSALALGIIGWQFVQMNETNREAVKEVKDTARLAAQVLVTRDMRVDEKLDKISGAFVDLQILKMDMERLHKAVMSGFDSQGRRIDKNDKDIEGLRKELYDRFVPPAANGGRAR